MKTGIREPINNNAMLTLKILTLEGFFKMVFKEVPNNNHNIIHGEPNTRKMSAIVNTCNK